MFDRKKIKEIIIRFTLSVTTVKLGTDVKQAGKINYLPLEILNDSPL